MRRRLRFGTLLALTAAGALALPAGVAAAAPSGGAAAYVCTGGAIPSGSYSSVTVTGSCAIPADANVTIRGNLTVRPGAALDADSAPSTIVVEHNVIGARGSSIGLGCTAAHGGCATEGSDNNGPYAGEESHILIKGNVSLDHVYNAALDGITVRHSVTSVGGGSGANPPGFVPFSIKDDTIGGNLTVIGLNSVWFGVIRSTIGGNVALIGNHLLDPDANEVVHDTIGKNLICLANSPAPQFGDAVEGMPAGYPYSTVGRHALGQCGFVLAP